MRKIRKTNARSKRRPDGSRQSGHAPHIILLIVPSRAFDRGLLKGVARYANCHGPWNFLREPPHYRQIDWKHKVTDRLRSGTIDAIIMREPERIEEIVRQGVPGICAPIMHRTVEGLINIITDNEAVGSMAAEHLLSRRFYHYAYCGFNGIYWSQTRGEAFRDAVTQGGYPCHMYQECNPNTTQGLWENELPRLMDWLKALPKPIGLMACNDDRSQHIADACRIANIHIPGEVALIGVDNDEFICNLANPTLSSICLNPEKVGYQAAEMLDAIMSGREVQTTTIIGGPTHIITRKSTDIMMVHDEDIRNALLFIRHNFSKPIQIVDVAQAVSISVRSLHKRFNHQVGCSVLDHIRRLRVERVCQLLMETNWSVTQIAAMMHISSTKQLDRIFQHVKNMTPSEYRHTFRIK